MFVRQYIVKQWYVFTRWSRKSWALFSAIGKQIKIGFTLRLGDMAYKRSLITGSFLSVSYYIGTDLARIFELDSGQKSTHNSIQQSFQLQILTRIASVDSIAINSINSIFKS